MKKLAALLIVLFMLGGIFTIAAEAGTYDKVKATIINTIKTRGQTSTPTPTASTAVRG